MNEITNKMRKIAGEILQKGEASVVIGWEKGTFGIYLHQPSLIKWKMWIA